MVCLGFKPRAAGWKVQTDPLSYGGTPSWSTNLGCNYCTARHTVTIQQHDKLTWVAAIEP